ncbi:MAG TPA: AmmeMemoRadiSam system protein A [Tepidisphaeraceae bacterium]|jgi:AmmeMemoRadiSam system protein A
MHFTADQRRILLDLARHTIRTELGESDNGTPAPFEISLDDAILNQPAGCFVTLHNLLNRRLRGCVGRLDAKDALVEAVRHSATHVLHDPRFVSFPVRRDDLPGLEIEITVIFPLRPAVDCQDFDLHNEGIYLTIQDRSGCFLPQVARDTGWSHQQLLERLCTEKLGLLASAWQEPGAKLMKFHALIIGPEPFLITEAL